MNDLILATRALRAGISDETARDGMCDDLEATIRKMEALGLGDNALIAPALGLLTLGRSKSHSSGLLGQQPGEPEVGEPEVGEPEVGEPEVGEPDVFAEARQAVAAALAKGAEQKPLKISYEYLQACTDSFHASKVIGSGAFGRVFYGFDRVTSLPFAVKKLDDRFRADDTNPALLAQQQRAAETEVAVLSRFRHPHIIRLLGFAFPDNGDRCLVYELLARGSLDAMIRVDKTASELTWRVRVRIACGVLKGLNYLHRGGEAHGGGQCFHRDVKAANICLSADLSPQIIDCGLAKYVQDDQEAAASSAGRFGTPGYKCPAYERNGVYDEKSEAFSFGMLLIEVITGEIQNARRDLYSVFIEEESEPLSDAFDSRAGDWPDAVKDEIISIANACLAARRTDRCDVISALQRCVRLDREFCQLTAEEEQLAAVRKELDELRQRQSLEFPVTPEKDKTCYICYDNFRADEGLECAPSDGVAHFVCTDCLEGQVQSASRPENMADLETRKGVGCAYPACASPIFTDGALARRVCDSTFALYIEAKGRLIEKQAYTDAHNGGGGDADSGKINAFSMAVEAGTKSRCPNHAVCGVVGVKDTNCTHMTCKECDTEWCYVCGLDVTSDECSKAPGSTGNEFYRHNVNWTSREGRCPMYLDQIYEIDDRWPSDGERALAHMLRWRCLRNLRTEYDRVGEQEFQRLLTAYPDGARGMPTALGGYTVEDIKEFDLSTPMFTKRDEDEEEEDEEEDEEENDE